MFLGTCFRRAFGLRGARFLGVLGALVRKVGQAKMKFWTGKEAKEATAGYKNGQAKMRSWTRQNPKDGCGKDMLRSGVMS